MDEFIEILINVYTLLLMIGAAAVVALVRYLSKPVWEALPGSRRFITLFGTMLLPAWPILVAMGLAMTPGWPLPDKLAKLPWLPKAVYGIICGSFSAGAFAWVKHTLEKKQLLLANTPGTPNLDAANDGPKA